MRVDGPLLLPDDPGPTEPARPTGPPARNDFVCPACGARQPRPEPEHVRPLNSEGPWGGLVPSLRCPACGRDVPQHLAERWNGLSIEEAAAEWRHVYK